MSTQWLGRISFLMISVLFAVGSPGFSQEAATDSNTQKLQTQKETAKSARKANEKKQADESTLGMAAPADADADNGVPNRRGV